VFPPGLAAVTGRAMAVTWGGYFRLSSGTSDYLLGKFQRGQPALETLMVVFACTMHVKITISKKPSD
jgi:hypothetical protein